MSTHKRIKTMQALLEGNACMKASPNFLNLKKEFQEVFAVRRIRITKRRRLLEVLHSARALDSTLKTFVTYYGCTSAKHKGKAPTAMGSYLVALCEHSVAAIGNITIDEMNKFQKNIVERRNFYLHEADAFPATEDEINIFLGEVDTCLGKVMSL